MAFFALCLLIGVAGAALFYYLGWYALLAIPLISAGLFLLARFSLTRLFLLPFQLKGRVLKGARTDVHEVFYLGVEEFDDAGDEPGKQYAYLIDMTIKPSGRAATPFTFWDPYELLVVPPDAKLSLSDPTDGSFGSVAHVSIFADGRWQTEDFDKLQGASRIQLKIHLVKPSPACKIRYYFYDVADVTLPPVSEDGLSLLH